MTRFECLEELARDLIGDGKTPDLFFVTDRGNVVTVTTDYRDAAGVWDAVTFDLCSRPFADFRPAEEQASKPLLDLPSAPIGFAGPRVG